MPLMQEVLVFYRQVVNSAESLGHYREWGVVLWSSCEAKV